MPGGRRQGSIALSEPGAHDVADLQRTIASLQDECEQKERFIATLAHELRNPITALRAAVHLQDLSGDDPSIREKTFDIIARQTDHMERLIDDLMDVSRLSRGKLSLDTRVIDLTSLVAQVFVDQQKSFDDVGVELTVELGDESIWVDGDPTRLTQVLSNLLNNARKATEIGDRVTVSVGRDKDQGCAVLSVSDTGVGMESDAVGRIFDIFTQAEASDRRDGGLGLGLAIVNGIVKLHDGQVEAFSDGPGEGSAFEVRLPLSAPPRSNADTTTGHDTIFERDILIIEDDRDVAQLLVQLLELEGHHVELAHDAEEGLEKIKASTPDAVLCDLHLPGEIDGHSLCRAVKIDPRFDAVHMVAMTGLSGEEMRETSLESGFDEHLTKPIDLDELRRALKPRPLHS